MSVPTAVIFRHEMFKRSEPFIARQAEALNMIRPIYLGRKRFGAAPVQATHHALWDDLPSSFATRVDQLVTRNPLGYLACLKSEPVGLIHAHFGVEGVYAQPLARTLDVPLITTFHGFDATTSTRNLLGSRKPSWITYVLRRAELAREGRLFLCVSEYIRRRVIALGFPESRTLVHYIGVDTSEIVPPADRRGRPTILHVGRLVEKKGARDLLLAFARLPRRHSSARLQIVGEGPLLPSLRKLADELGLTDRVEFLGPLPSEMVLGMMGEATVICQPSVTAASGDTEGLPIVLLEAAASGLPIVSTRHAGIPELIESGRTGILVDERSPGQLAAALDEVLADVAGRKRLALAARTRVEVDFDLKRQSNRLADMYRELM